MFEELGVGGSFFMKAEKEEESGCVFCGKEGSTSFREKHICDYCFDELFEWAYNGRVCKILDRFKEKIDMILKREMLR